MSLLGTSQPNQTSKFIKEILYKILLYLKKPRLPLNRDITQYATSQLLLDESKEARRWTGRFMALLAQREVFYDPLNTHQNFEQHLKGKNIPAKLRLALISHSLRKNMDARLSNESLGFVNFCLGKLYLLPDVVPIICYLLIRNKNGLNPLLDDLRVLREHASVIKAILEGLSKVIPHLDSAHILVLLETLKIF